jgi:hypothetical protein
MGFLKTLNAKSISKGTNTFLSNTSAGVGNSIKNITGGITPDFKEVTGEVNSLLSSPTLMIGMVGIGVIILYGISQAGSTANKGLSVIDNDPQLGMSAMQMAANS